MSDSLRPHGHHTSLSFTISRSLLSFMSTESVIPPNHLILCQPLLLLLQFFPAPRSFPMNQLFMSLTVLKTVWITTNWKILKEIGTPDHLNLPPEKSVCRSRSNSYNRRWNNRLVPNWERSMSRLYIVTLLI